jgi:hypothetical protein
MLHSCGHESYEWPQIYQQDPDFSTTYQLLGTGVNATDFHIYDRLLFHLGHLCVPASECAKMIWESHYCQMAGDFGVEKTLVVLQKHFYWPKLRHDISKYIRSSTSCAITKTTIKKQGLCTLLPTLEKPRESILMDYIFVLPSTKQGNDCVFVVVDQFAKMSILIAWKKNITAVYTSKLFFKLVWVYFGIPWTIISDRDNRFLNTFWLSLWSLLDTKLTKSTSFHPQIDRQTKFVN